MSALDAAYRRGFADLYEPADLPLSCGGCGARIQARDLELVEEPRSCGCVPVPAPEPYELAGDCGAPDCGAPPAPYQAATEACLSCGAPHLPRQPSVRGWRARVEQAAIYVGGPGWPWAVGRTAEEAEEAWRRMVAAGLALASATERAAAERFRADLDAARHDAGTLAGWRIVVLDDRGAFRALPVLADEPTDDGGRRVTVAVPGTTEGEGPRPLAVYEGPGARGPTGRRVALALLSGARARWTWRGMRPPTPRERATP